MFIRSQFDLTFGASDTTKSSAFCVCCVFPAIFGLTLWVRFGQSDLAPHRLQIYAINVSRYMRQTYGLRSFPDVLYMKFWG